MAPKKLFSAHVGKQISIFIENRPGTLGHVIDLLRAEGINMLALSLSEGLEGGYLRVIVDQRKHGQAVRVLRAKGILVIERVVVLLEVANQPGGMASAIDLWAKAGINIEYAYSATGPGADHSLIIARVPNAREAIAALRLG
jgi:hypothetical protein